jgi:hypothetical protein
MKYARPLSFALAAAVATLYLGGCGGQDDDEATADSTAALLEQPNGGMTTAPEMPDFADGAFVTLPPLSETVGVDALLDESGSYAGDAVQAPQRRVIRVMMLWGHLPRPNEAAAPGAVTAPTTRTDWSGTVSVDAGRVSVRRSIGFESGDSVAARTDPSTVSFVSRTQPFVDGLALTVRADAATNPVLHFRTAAITLDLPLPDADGAVRYLPDGRNGVYYAAFVERPGCNQGFVLGHWQRVRAHLGTFRGRVFGLGGAPHGAVRGIWGRSRTGEQRFFGKHINNAGAFNGLLGGTYGDGRFAGVWGLRDGSRGGLVGRYADGREPGDGRGVFLGRWNESCPVR